MSAQQQQQQAGSAPSEKKKEEKPQYPPPNYDLDTYAKQYTGHGRINRLKFIGESCKELAPAAFRMALQELKSTTNTALYQEVCKLSSTPVDSAWVESTDRKAQLQMERLEQELNGFKTNLIKESIRTGHNDLGDFHYERGDLNSALKCYLRARDYCTTPAHTLDCCDRVIRVALEMGNYAHVTSYVTRAEGTPELADPVLIAKLKVASGLAFLANKKYNIAARKFLEVSADLGSSYTEIVIPQDVAVYGGLCALAAFDRDELKSKVLENGGGFKEFLDLVPDVRDMLHDFYHSRYASCFKIIERLRADVQLDLYLSPHAQALLNDIRRKALVQYFTPYQSLDIATMAKAFNTTVPGMERELSLLIMDGQIQARIDSATKILYARQADLRDAAFKTALQMGSDYEQDTKEMLRRMDMLRHDVSVRPPPKPLGGQSMAMRGMNALFGGAFMSAFGRG